ncbi:MAG: ribonuclease III [Candidatus Marinimicrobia bacterium]|nr:ribonuclease III [Candidatus Neomarinimicrobiota bacterium]
MKSLLSKLFSNKKSLSAFEKRVGFSFRKQKLLKRAFTHSSTLKKNSIPYERLEFLGDAVLDLVVSEYLYKNYPEMNEGSLTKKRMKYVNGHYLYRIAETLDLEEDCIIDKSVDMENLPTRKKILADILESVVGAIYLAKGLARTKKFIINWIIENDDVSSSAHKINYKGKIIEYCQKHNIHDLKFQILDVCGPDHKRKYKIAIFFNDKHHATATSTTKKSAEQLASRRTLEQIKDTNIKL